MKQFGLKIVFGNGCVPQFPDGWKIARRSFAEVVAIAADGKEYLIGDGVLYPLKTCPPIGIQSSSPKPGQKYIDVNASIKLPPLET